ncbi:MAG: putative DNA binding domain-containing protein [Bacteroidaceae bacterium]|nr:putative DNA binding domain-containing protein [Bacteroidaceae bacterium]
MALPININDLLNKNKVEGNRIEFKKGWNPTKIYQSICAFANDFDNLGGGYILVGVEEENGKAKRPVKGIAENQIDQIQKDMVGFNNKIDPYYLPRTSVEEIDERIIFVIWVPSGVNRPYNVMEDVNAKHSKPKYYIRSGSCTIEAKGEALDQLRDLANRTPFDDRGNPDIKIDDISPVLVYDHLKKIGSKLANKFSGDGLESILEQMDLYDGPTERRYIKNVAAMMFCENLKKFFPVSRVEIVVFPNGRIKDPNNFYEVPTITGTVPQMINQTLNQLRTFIREYIVKPKDKAESIRYFNYPYQALEEAVVNALYHRDYQEREPVEITIEPDRISILSYAGPDRSVTVDAIKRGDVLRSRRYRNRRLGDFLKELELTEGRCTGIPTIQEELAKNGSPRATIETDENRTFFLIDIPCHEGIETDLRKESIISQEKTELSQEKTELSQEKTELSQEKTELSQEKTELSQGVNSKRIRSKQNKQKFQKALIDFCNEPKSLEEITTKFGFKDKYRFKKVYIDPILNKYLFIHKSDEHKVYSQQYINKKE